MCKVLQGQDPQQQYLQELLNMRLKVTLLIVCVCLCVYVCVIYVLRSCVFGGE